MAQPLTHLSLTIPQGRKFGAVERRGFEALALGHAVYRVRCADEPWYVVGCQDGVVTWGALDTAQPFGRMSDAQEAADRVAVIYGDTVSVTIEMTE